MKTNKVDFDDYANDYNELLAQSTQFFSDDEDYFARYKVDLIANQELGNVRRILEYGCGIGRNISALKDGFPLAEIIGSDIAPASLELAKKLNPEVEFYHEGQGNSDTFGEKFDLIFVAGVFHHIPLAERAQEAEKLFERLAPAGSIFVFEHNPFNPITRRIVSTCPYDEDAILLRPKELGGLLRGAGFEVLEQSYCLFVPPKLQRLLFLEKWLTKFPLGGQYWVRAGKSAA